MNLGSCHDLVVLFAAKVSSYLKRAPMVCPQVRIVKRQGLPLLMRLNKNGPWSSEVVRLTSGILRNLASNPANRTAMYRIELGEKMQAATSAVRVLFTSAELRL